MSNTAHAHVKHSTRTCTHDKIHALLIHTPSVVFQGRALRFAKCFLNLDFHFSSATVQISLAPTRRASLERGPDATTCAKEMETHTSLDKKLNYRSVARVKPQA